MTVEAYITQSRAEGKVITNEYVNGVDYTLITEHDGWVTIIERNLSGYKYLIDCESTADICYTGCGKLLNCWITWLEEREYDEYGGYELTGNVWRAIEREV